MNLTEQELKVQVLDFERELLSAFRGELRKVNTLLPMANQSNGTACRVAATAMGTKFTPHSVEGQILLEEHQRHSSGALYTNAPNNGRKKPDVVKA